MLDLTSSDRGFARCISSPCCPFLCVPSLRLSFLLGVCLPVFLFFLSVSVLPVLILYTFVLSLFLFCRFTFRLFVFFPFICISRGIFSLCSAFFRSLCFLPFRFLFLSFFLFFFLSSLLSLLLSCVLCNRCACSRLKAISSFLRGVKMMPLILPRLRWQRKKVLPRSKEGALRWNESGRRERFFI